MLAFTIISRMNIGKWYNSKESIMYEHEYIHIHIDKKMLIYEEVRVFMWVVSFFDD